MSIEVDVSGFTDLHLRYRRWLTVEDARYDRATVAAGATVLWENLRGVEDPVDHVDREWRTVVHDLSAVPKSDTLTVQFRLESDDARQLGGWNIDDVCVLGTPGPSQPAPPPPDEDEGCSCTSTKRETRSTGWFVVFVGVASMWRRINRP